MPKIGLVGITPRSTFDDNQGRVFRLVISAEGGRAAIVDASGLLEYQELQAVLAHQTGCLFRDLAIEAVEDPRTGGARGWGRSACSSAVRTRVRR